MIPVACVTALEEDPHDEADPKDIEEWGDDLNEGATSHPTL
jgi:hypothetical protein